MRAQLSVESTIICEVDGGKPSILPDLSDTIANVRKEYEAFNAKSLSDLDNYYKDKVWIFTLLTKSLKSLNKKI